MTLKIENVVACIAIAETLGDDTIPDSATNEMQIIKEVLQAQAAEITRLRTELETAEEKWYSIGYRQNDKDYENYKAGLNDGRVTKYAEAKAAEHKEAKR
jgi:hypothetical protein